VSVIILRLVAEELQIPISIDEIISCRSDHKVVSRSDLKKEDGKLKKHFKEWFYASNNPERLINKFCE